MTLDIQSTTSDRMSRKEAAAYLDLAERTLAIWASNTYRKNHGGKVKIPFYKVGRLVRYSKRDLDQWLAENKQQ